MSTCPKLYIYAAMAAQKAIEISGKRIAPGEMMKVKTKLARLPSGTEIDLPVYVYRAAKPGPVVLLSGGLHGDEINGIEIVRRMLEQATFEKLERGSVIAIPVMNIFGFLNFSRDVPDGKDVNRSFPGNVAGSLAARIAHFLTHEIIVKIDCGVDFHTGGASRYNHPQVRYAAADGGSLELAKAFGAPVMLQNGHIQKSLRHQAYKMGKSIIVYEGGESMRLDENVVITGIAGAMRLLKHLEMLSDAPPAYGPGILCATSTWVRAKHSGIYSGVVQSGSYVAEKEVLGHITDPFGAFKVKMKSPAKAFVLGHNNMPIVNQGDALLHLGIVAEK